MVTKLDNFPAHGRSLHDWDALMDGGIYELQAQVDFACQTHSMRSLALNQARKRGGKVRTHIDKATGNITIQFIENAPAEPVNDYNGERD